MKQKIEPLNFLVQNVTDINSSKKSTKSEKISSLIKKLMKNTSINGIPNLISSSSLSVKIIWIICLLVSSASCAYFIVYTVLNYLRYEVISTTNPIYEGESQFPTLTFCSTIQPFFSLPLLQCKFNNIDCRFNFEEFQELNYGKCFRFNSGINLMNESVQILNSKVAGMKYGLRIDLNVSLSDKYAFNELAIYIHNYTEKPINILHRGFRITTGSTTYYQIERNFENRLGIPYNDCILDLNEFSLNKTIIDYYQRVNDSYSQTECVRLCRNLKNADNSNCNCVDPSFLENTISCSSNKNLTVVNCYHSFTTNFLESNVFEICSQYCPYQCEVIEYEVKSWSEEYPSTGNISNGFDYKAFQTYTNVKSGYVSIRAFFPELKYKNIEQNAKVYIFDLVSNVGGTLGLFLGCSFLSFIEILELLIEIFYHLVQD